MCQFLIAAIYKFISAPGCFIFSTFDHMCHPDFFKLLQNSYARNADYRFALFAISFSQKEYSYNFRATEKYSRALLKNTKDSSIFSGQRYNSNSRNLIVENEKSDSLEKSNFPVGM